jgi:hypothetical protein
VTYSFAAATAVSTENLMEVVDNTFLFINNYLASSFGAGNQIIYVSLLGFHTAHSADFTTIQFMATAQFLEPSDAATFIPNTSDLDLLLERAFTAPTVQALLLLLRNLPAVNPFRQATDAQYALVATPTFAPSRSPQTPETGTASEAGTAVATTAGIAGAILVACFITGLVAFYRWGVFDKLRSAKKEPKYSKAPEKERSVKERKSGRNAPEKEKNIKERQTARRPSHADDQSCASDWTSSSVGSISPSSNSSSSSHVDNSGYQSRIIDEDVEIKFLYPADGGLNQDHLYVSDPLFPPSPLMSEEEKGRKKRQNI